jgi:hypothetical protein
MSETGIGKAGFGWAEADVASFSAKERKTSDCFN